MTSCLVADDGALASEQTPQRRAPHYIRLTMPLFFHRRRFLHYLIRGRGEPLLLLHGLGFSGGDLAYQVRALEGQFRVIVPDLPGCGRAPLP